MSRMSVSLANLQKAYEKAWDARIEARDAYRKVGNDYDRAKRALYKAEDVCIKAAEVYHNARRRR